MDMEEITGSGMRVSEVGAAVNELHAQLMRTKEVLGMTEDKLCSILAPAIPSDKVAASRVSSSVPLAEELYSIAEQLQAVNNNFLNMKERIEV
jgi:hypothetical protein